MKLGWSLKKKKKVITLCEARFPSFELGNDEKRAPQMVMTFFFFLEITPISCIKWKCTPVPRHPNLKPHLSVPLLTKQKLIRPKNFVTSKFAIRCPDFSFSKYGNPNINARHINSNLKQEKHFAEKSAVRFPGVK